MGRRSARIGLKTGNSAEERLVLVYDGRDGRGMIAGDGRRRLAFQATVNGLQLVPGTFSTINSREVRDFAAEALMADVLPFPRSLDRKLVNRQAMYDAGLRREKAAAHLRRQFDLQRTTIQRRGIDPALAEVEVERLEKTLISALGRMGVGLTLEAAS